MADMNSSSTKMSENFLENPFHICKDHRLQITEDVSQRYASLRLESGSKTRQESDKQKENDSLDLDNEVRSLLDHFKSEQVWLYFYKQMSLSFSK